MRVGPRLAVVDFVLQEAALDVHAPHHPIGGWKDFLIHLVTISIGLLIAVGIEGCVELHREHKLVREARETMREEIQHNSDEMRGAVVKLDQQAATLKKNIEVLTRIQENPQDKAAQEAQINRRLLDRWPAGDGLEDGADDRGTVVYALRGGTALLRCVRLAEGISRSAGQDP